MSAKKYFLISSLIIIINICAIAEAVTLNQRPTSILKSTFALESSGKSLNFDPNLYRFLIYDTQGGEDSIQQAMQIFEIPYDLRNRDNPVTLGDLQTHNILIVGWNVFGDTSGLDPAILASGIKGRVLLGGHDADYHTVYGPEAGKTFLSQAISYILAASGTSPKKLLDFLGRNCYTALVIKSWRRTPSINM